MKPNETPPPAGQPNADTPPASLTAVRVGRRKAAPPASSKAGDLTRQLGTDAPADARAADRSDTAPVPANVAPAPPAAAPAIEPPPPAIEPPRAAAQPPAPEPPRPTAPPPLTIERPRVAAPPAAPPQPPTRLLGEDEIRQLLDPPERRAALQPPPAPPPASSPAPNPPLAPPLMVEPDERDAILPAPTAPELRLVAESAEPQAKAQAPVERQPSAAAPASTIDQIIDYWDSLRGAKPVPPLDALDRGHVSRSWPNCMLVAYGGANTVTPKLTRIGEENGEIEYLEMVIHWILSRGQLAARRGEPMEEEKRFPVTGGNARYQLLLLPLATADGKSEHVLCHLLRVKEAAKPKGGAFKRWLAS